jgi:hypothetical protein
VNAILLAAVVGAVLVAVGVLGSAWTFFEISGVEATADKKGDRSSGLAPGEWANLAEKMSPLMRTTGGISLVQLLLGTLLLTTAAIATAAGT